MDVSIIDIEEIKRRREALNDGKGASQEDCAKRAEFKSRQQWNEIEAGRQPVITTATLAALARALGCEPADLLKRKPAQGRRKLAKA